MGVDMMHDQMKELGFGQMTGIDIAGEARGILPSTQWKRSSYKRPEQQRWYSGETISLGIGQGYNSFTMLQLAQAVATLANNGTPQAAFGARGGGRGNQSSPSGDIGCPNPLAFSS
jgi:penicillin-binding protein 2